MQNDLGTELLSLATTLEMRLDTVLEHAVSRLAALSEAETAALFLFDPAEVRPTLAATAVQGDGATPAELFFRRAVQDGGARLAETCGQGLPSPVPDHRCGAAGPTLRQGSRSSVWFPLLEHRRAVGFLVLEAGRPGAFSAAVGKLAPVCREIVPGLQRALLRHWMQQIGAPVDVVGRSPAFLELERQIRQAGSCAEGSVLVTGERGSGKEVVAWAIHAWSRRRSRPFVPLLAAACSDSMTADELFGHERNSFTGAAQSRPGKFQAADGGTLMLDEAGDLPAPIQASFLRVLESGELQRIGRDETLRVNVRVVAATNRDLASLMAEGRFRRDLYDRLSFFEVTVPPLRERSEDIPLLARHFLRSTCPNTWRSSVFQQEGICGNCCHVHPPPARHRTFLPPSRRTRGRATSGSCAMLSAGWRPPSPDEALGLAHLPEGMQRAVQPAPSKDDAWSLDGALRRHIENVLRHTGSNQSEAARLLGLPLSTLRSKMKRLGMIRLRRADLQGCDISQGAVRPCDPAQGQEPGRSHSNRLKMFQIKEIPSPAGPLFRLAPALRSPDDRSVEPASLPEGGRNAPHQQLHDLRRSPRGAGRGASHPRLHRGL